MTTQELQNLRKDIQKLKLEIRLVATVAMACAIYIGLYG